MVNVRLRFGNNRVNRTRTRLHCFWGPSDQRAAKKIKQLPALGKVKCHDRFRLRPSLMSIRVATYLNPLVLRSVHHKRTIVEHVWAS